MKDDLYIYMWFNFYRKGKRVNEERVNVLLFLEKPIIRVLYLGGAAGTAAQANKI